MLIIKCEFYPMASLKFKNVLGLRIVVPMEVPFLTLRDRAFDLPIR